MTPERARELFVDARVARLATTGGEGPHLVTLALAVHPGRDTVYSTAHGPDRDTLADVAADPRVCLLADRYEDAAWDVWWAVRAYGTARVLHPEDGEARGAVDLLATRYPQYERSRPTGPVIAVDVARWRGWQAGVTA